MEQSFIKLGRGHHGWARDNPLYLTLDDKRRHILLTGRTGMGKSTLLANLFAQEANSGRAAMLIDPHGDLAKLATDLVPPRRLHKVLYFDPTDIDHPVGFNILAEVPVNQRGTLAGEIVDIIRSLWPDSWGARMDYILINAVRALLDIKGATFLNIHKLLVDGAYRVKILPLLTDPINHEFWSSTYPKLRKEYGMDAISPIINKIEQFTAIPTVRNILTQAKSTFSPRYLIDNNYLIIVSLAKGSQLLGDHHARLLGSLLVAAFGTAAMTRADTPEAERKDFTMIIDEFHNYSTTKLATFLSEARKYRLSLVLAHQYLDQLAPGIRSAVLGSVGSIIAFRLGAEDAQTYARELDLPPHILTDTPIGAARCKLLVHGTTCTDVYLETAPVPPRHGHGHKLVPHSRMKFGTDRRKVEDRVAAFLKDLIPPQAY